MDTQTLLALAGGPGTIPLTPKRADELSAEINAILDVAHDSCGRLMFEDEPASFVATLEELALTEAL